MVNKIFGIGLSRTGTKSLTESLNILGYSAVHWDYTKNLILYEDKSLYICYDKFNKHDAFIDTPIVRTYKYLDRQFTESKFIYTRRNIEDWVKSCENLFTLNITEDELKERYKNSSNRDQLHIDLYGCIEFNKDKFIDFYNKHEKDVLEYFKDRREDLLILDICTDSNIWIKLSEFLEKDIPSEDFPKIGKWPTELPAGAATQFHT
jgi:hypothetical protein